MIPSNICTFATNKVKDDIRLFLYSLSYSNPNCNVVLFSDDEIKSCIENEWNNILLNIHIVNNLNQYSNKTRQQMEEERIWTDFQTVKSNLIDYSLSIYNDILYLDSDIFIINQIELPINTIDEYNKCDLILSPHYINKQNTNGVGFFNGGVIWTKNKDFTTKWREFTKKSRYFDQASLEDCNRIFNTLYFDENYNFSWWRLNDSDDPPNIIASYLKYNDQNIYYKGKPLIFVHTHFKQYEKHFLNFNLLMKNLLSNCKEKNHLFDLLTM
jgi:hypothetical protein